MAYDKNQHATTPGELLPVFSVQVTVTFQTKNKNITGQLFRVTAAVLTTRELHYALRLDAGGVEQLMFELIQLTTEMLM